MPILYTSTAYPPSIGGAQLQLHMLAQHIQAHTPVGVLYQWDEHRTDWLRGTTINAPPARKTPPVDGVPVYRVTLGQKQRRQVLPWVYLYPLLQGPAIDRISQALYAQIEAAIPQVIEQPPQIVHNTRIGREFLTAASLRYARQHDIPFVLTPNHHHHWRGWFYRHFLELYQQADAVIAYTHYGRDELIDLGLSPDKVYVIGAGPILAETGDGERFRSTHQLAPDVPVVLFLGQKYEYKRFDLVLEATSQVWQQHPRTHFMFIGPRTDYSRRVFSRFSDPRIIEVDSVDLQTKTDALAGCDLLCVPSEKESFGGVYIEAAHFQKPVIGGSAPAVREVIKDGETGFVVGSRIRELATKINTLLSDTAMSRSFGEANEQHAQQYTWPALTERARLLYADLR